MILLKYYSVEQSIVVHCSTGAGPTGSFIGKFRSKSTKKLTSILALCNTLSALEAETTIDIFQMVKSLRTQRQNMVKTNEQV